MDHSLPTAAVLDDRTVAYITRAGKPFDDLRQVAAQLAGLLVLAASGAKEATPHHPMLELAIRQHDEADQALRALQPTERARAHHAHLVRAVDALQVALTCARDGLRGDAPSRIDPILIAVQSGYAQLQRAADQLPGFELIAFNQGCCAGVTPGSAAPIAQVRR